MIILGKLLGAYLGLQGAKLSGQNPGAGALAGVVLGHMFDVWLHLRITQLRARKYWSARLRTEFAERFLISVFSMVAKLCEVDGPTNAEEQAAIANLMNGMLRLSRKDKKRALQVLRNHRKLNTSFQYDAVQFFELYQQEPVVLNGFVASLFAIAAADGPITHDEERLIATAAQLFLLDEDTYFSLRNRYIGPSAGAHSSYGGDRAGSKNGNGAAPRTLEHFYEVLGCKPDDTPQKIKQSYRKLVSDYHPDKIVSKDLPEGFIQFANEKFKSIQEAYEAVKTARGFT